MARTTPFCSCRSLTCDALSVILSRKRKPHKTPRLANPQLPVRETQSGADYSRGWRPQVPSNACGLEGAVLILRRNGFAVSQFEVPLCLAGFRRLCPERRAFSRYLRSMLLSLSLVLKH